MSKCLECAGYGMIKHSDDYNTICHSCEGIGKMKVADKLSLFGKAGDSVKKPELDRIERLIDNFINQASYSDLLNTNNLAIAIKVEALKLALECVGEDLIIGKKEWKRMSLGQKDYIIGKNQEKENIRKALKKALEDK